MKGIGFSGRKKEVFWDIAFFAVLWAGFVAVTGYLFYSQAYGTPDYFPSDVKAYILEMQGLESGYEYPYPIYFKLGALFMTFLRPETAAAAALTFLNSLSPIALKYYLDRYLTKEKEGLLPKMGVTVLVFTLFMVSMIFPLRKNFPGTYGHYIGVFSPNPHHNATYLAARPFAIATFFQFVSLLSEYEERFRWKKGICFGFFLLLSTMTKPSFTLVFVVSAGIVMLWRLGRSRFRNLKNTVFLGLCFLPTFCDLLYQFGGVFGGSGSGVGFGWLKAWSYHCKNIPVAVLAALAFPLLVFVLHIKEAKRDDLYRFCALFLAVGLGTMALLYEKGFREIDMNFAWGYMYGMFFAFAGAAVLLVKDTAAGKRNRYLLAAEWGVYLLHLGCGLLYLKNSLAGLSYY